MIRHAVSINLLQFIGEDFPGFRVRCVETFALLCKPHCRKTLDCTKCYSIINGTVHLYWTKILISPWDIQFISLYTCWQLTWKLKTLGLAGVVLMGTKVLYKSEDISVPPRTLEFLQFCMGYSDFFCFQSEVVKKFQIFLYNWVTFTKQLIVWIFNILFNMVE